MLCFVDDRLCPRSGGGEGRKVSHLKKYHFDLKIVHKLYHCVCLILNAKNAQCKISCR